jgi:Flp pilus assembly protein TadG
VLVNRHGHFILTPRTGCGTLRRGTSATEFAIVLPVLLLLLLGCVDFGRAAYWAVALHSAVGSGANYGATHRVSELNRSSWEARLRQRVQEEMQQIPDFDSALLTIQVSTIAETDQTVRLSIVGQYPFETLVEWPGIPGSISLRSGITALQYR